MTVETLKAVKGNIGQILGPDRPFEPGTGFGPLVGRGSGQLSDFAWLNSWTPLVREPVFEAIGEAGFRVVGIPAEIELSGQPGELLIELEVRPTARIHPSPPLRVCELCARVPTFRGRGIDGASFDHTIPLQRIQEWPTRILVNEPFGQFLVDRDFEGVELTSQTLVHSGSVG